MEDQKIKDSKGLLYEPPPFVEQSFWDAYNKIVPDVLDAPAGTKRLRFVWGCDRLEYCAGYWERRYLDTDNNPPKYVGRCRWIIEGWQPPSVYDKKQWLNDAHLLGEWPANGVWDFVAFHENLATKEFLPLDQSALNHLTVWAHWQGRGKNRSIDHLMQEKLNLWHQQHTARQAAANEVSSAFGEAVVKEFEKAKDTPDAYSFPSTPLTIPTGYKKTEGGILTPH